MDRIPEGHEADLFTWKPASEWDEGWVAFDIPTARKLANTFLGAFDALRIFPTPAG